MILKESLVRHVLSLWMTIEKIILKHCLVLPIVTAALLFGIGAPGSGPNERTKHPISNVNSFAEHLDSYISCLVSPSVRGAVNHVIFENGSETDGYVISYIPKSLNPPHRAESEGLKQYYVRYGESFKIAEHYELEFMFGKRYVPVLNVFWGVSLEGVESKGRKPSINAA